MTAIGTREEEKKKRILIVDVRVLWLTTAPAEGKSLTRYSDGHFRRPLSLHWWI